MGYSPMKVAISSPVCKFHTLTVLSDEPEITRLLSAVTATAFTESLWPVKVKSSFLVFKFQTLTVLSLELEINRLLSAVTATVFTESL
jgi:hypothetical protein